MRLAALAVTTVLLVGCSMGDDAPSYDASDYRAGDCRDASVHVFAVEKAVRPEVMSGAKAGRAATELTAAQKALIAVLPGVADATVKASAQEVVDAVGFYRIGVDAQNFTPRMATDVMRASDEFLETCAV